jgi:4-amino-4-deoxy-L-arabinose transferase-like glycosyltransferase
MTPRGETRLAVATLVAGVAALAAIRVWLAFRLDPAPDEAWYWVWSRDPGLSYPDHPPAVAFLIRLGTSVCGDTPLGIRLGTIALGLIGIALLFGLGRELGLSRPRAAAGALLGSLLPAPAAGALLATPDAALGALWIAAAWLLVRVARSAEPRREQWVGLGLLLGAGLWSKHAAWLLPLVAAATLALQGRLRQQLRRPGPWLGLLVAALVVAPHLAAEIRAGLPSASLQAAHLLGALPGSGAGGLTGLGERLGGLVAGQIGLLGPVLLWLLVRGATRRGGGDPGLTAILMAIAVPVAATLVAAFFTHPEQNWASLGHALAPAAALAVVSRARTDGSWSPGKERALLAALVLPLLVVSALVHVHAARPFLPLPPERDPVSRLHGWAGLSRGIAALADAAGAEAWICDDYGLAAELAFDRARGLPPSPAGRGAGVRADEGVGRATMILSTDRPWPGPRRFSRALLLDLEDDWAGARPGADCAAIGPPSTIELRRADGAVVRHVAARSGEGCSLRGK